MNMEESIKALLQKVLDDHGGNKSAAAASLGVNNVTFWGWIKNTRKKQTSSNSKRNIQSKKLA